MVKTNCTNNEKFKFILNVLNGRTNKDVGLNSDDFSLYEICTAEQPLTDHNNNLMLFHGTSIKNAAGILQHGFRNSTFAKHGRGVYLTEYFDFAVWISKLRSDFLQSFSFEFEVEKAVFINEVVFDSEKLKSVEFGKFELLRSHSDPLKHPFCKFISSVLRSNKQPSNFEVDDKGRKYRNIEVTKLNLHDKFVADASVVIPRYLVTTEVKTNKNIDEWLGLN